MEALQWFDAAVGRVREALQHAGSMRGKPGYQQALREYESAVEDLEKVAREIGDSLHAQET